MSEKMLIGIIGCGKISAAYIKGAQKVSGLKIKSCADIFMNSAQSMAEEYNCQAVTVDELLLDPEIELVVNLTTPQAHVEVGLKVLEAGKHVYSEKPLAVELEGARQLLDLAEEKHLRVGCAPDTFLGGGIQTSRKLLDDGLIGEPVSGTAFMCTHGHERWHPAPAFYYDIGGGPMLDMGPYYITALVNLLGPVKHVFGITGRAFEERVATSEGAAGQRIPVKVDTHYSGVLVFECGAIVTVIQSFDVWKHSLPFIEIHGTKASLSVPNPNTFRGPVCYGENRDTEWVERPLLYPENARVIGVVDMAHAIRNNAPHRANGMLAYHVLEVITAFERSSNSGKKINIKSIVERPNPLPEGLSEWEVS